MVIPTLKAEAWKDNMARNSAIFGAMSGFMMLLFTPWFGRLSDRIPRRRAWLLTGCMNSVSVIALLIGGKTAGLWAYEVAEALTAPLRQIETMAFIYLQDLVPPDDRNLVFAVSWAVFTAFTFFIMLMAGVVAEHSSGLIGPCLFDLASLILFVLVSLCINTVGDPKLRNTTQSSVRVVSSSALEEQHAEVCSARSSLSVACSSAVRRSVSDSLPSHQTGDMQESGSCPKAPDASAQVGKCWSTGSTMRTIHFLCSNPNLRNLAFIFFLIGLPERLELNVGPQYNFQSLDLMLTANSTLNAIHIQGQKRVTETSGFSKSLATFCFSLSVGAIGSSMGPLRLVKILIPLTAISQFLPLCLLLEPAMWVVAVASLCAPLGGAIFIPLNALASICSPPDRVGEAISAMTAVKELAPLLANFLTPQLISFIGTDSLWVFFVISGIMIMLAIPFALDMKSVQSDDGHSYKQDDAGASIDSTDDGDISSQEESSGSESSVV